MKAFSFLNIAPFFFGLVALGGCDSNEDGDQRQPTAAEVKAYTDEINLVEAQAQANAVSESRAKEETEDRKHLARVPAQN